MGKYFLKDGVMFYGDDVLGTLAGVQKTEEISNNKIILEGKLFVTAGSTISITNPETGNSEVSMSDFKSCYFAANAQSVHDFKILSYKKYSKSPYNQYFGMNEVASTVGGTYAYSGLKGNDIPTRSFAVENQSLYSQNYYFIIGGHR